MNKTWSAAAIAQRLAALVDAHGVPNHFQLHEVGGDVGRKADILALAQVARLQEGAVNAELAALGLQATYCVRLHDRPAQIQVARVKGRAATTNGEGAVNQRVGRIVVESRGARRTTWSLVEGDFEALPVGEYEVFVRTAPPASDHTRERVLDGATRCDTLRVAGDSGPKGE